MSGRQPMIGRRGAVAVLAALALVVAGCSNTVSGQSGHSGSQASSPAPGIPATGGGIGATPSAPSTTPGGGTGTDQQTATAPPTASGGTSGAGGAGGGNESAGTAPVELSCARPEVTVTGAPFCYTQPAGFYDYSKHTDYAPGWTYRTLLATGEHEAIEVLAQPVQSNLDGFTSAGAFDFADQFRQQPGQTGIISATALTPGTVAGARAYRQDVVFTGGVNAVNRFILRGHSLVYVSCQYLDKQAEVLAACTSILASLKIQDS